LLTLMLQMQLSRALEILRKEGPITLGKKGCEYFQAQIDKEYVWIRDLIVLYRKRFQDNTLDEVSDTVLLEQPGKRDRSIRAAQIRDELQGLAQFIEQKDHHAVMEIGVNNGGTLWTWSRILDPEVLIGLDLPGGEFGEEYGERQQRYFRYFCSGDNPHLVFGNSHSRDTKAEISDILGNRKLDFLFIDGDHTYEGVKKDFEMYQEFVRDGGYIAFHDIVPHPKKEPDVKSMKKKHPQMRDEHFHWSPDAVDCEVDEFWKDLIADLKEGEITEIISHPHQTWGGIGIVKYNPD
jgi:predicted O-methyltransferase YrrM